jgi:type I restriction enzyme, S subunit
MTSVDKLPEGWAWTTVGEMSVNFDGQRVPVKAGDREKRAGQYPYYGASGVIDTIDDFLFDGHYLLIAEDGANLLSRSTPIAFRATGRFWVNNHAHVVQLRDGIPLNFLEHFLNSINLQFYITGTAQPKLNQVSLNNIRCPLPPLPEQRRIVEKVDELLSDLDAGVAALKRAQARLKKYRAAVLMAAVSGDLTAEWRAAHPNTEPASKLLDRILAERRQKWGAAQVAKFAASGKILPKTWQEKYEEPSPVTEVPPDQLPPGWCWASIDQLSKVVRGASPRPAGDPRFFGGGHTSWITVGALTADEGIYLRSVTESLTEAGREASRFIEPETLLLTNSGATLGVPKITLIGGCINDGSVALLDVYHPLKLYLFFFLKGQTKRLRSINQGAAQPNLNTGIVKSLVVPLPPLVEQEVINQEVEQRLSVLDATEDYIAASLTRSSRLRQSILKEAFAGRLVPQDPSDEPASALIERIRKARSATPVARPGRSRARAQRKQEKQRTLFEDTADGSV